MSSKNPARRIIAALSALDAADGPAARLAAARQLREAADELEAAQVSAARKAGATWVEIGACYGLTKQGAQQRFRALREQEPGKKKAEPRGAGPGQSGAGQTGAGQTGAGQSGAGAGQN